MAKTRATKKVPEQTAAQTKVAPIDQLDQKPLKLLILPQYASPEARVCTLANPATSRPSRYLYCPETGIYEFLQVTAPRSARRSWLLSRSIQSRNIIAANDTDQAEKAGHEANLLLPPKEELLEKEAAGVVSKGYTISAPSLFTATRIDLLFLVLPALCTQAPKDSKGLFLSADDLLDTISDQSKHFRYLIEDRVIRQKFETRMSSVCDIVDGGDEKMYRLNMDKLLNELLAKARSMISKGLPATVESRFVTKALEAPVMSLRREETVASQKSKVIETTSDPESQSTATEPQSNVITPNESISSTQTDLTIPEPAASPSASEDIKDLLRLRTAISYILSSYVPVALGLTLKTMLASLLSPVDFSSLDKHLSDLASLRAEALASRSFGDFSRKRSAFDDDEAAEKRAEKKRKEEEEKKAKKSESRSLRDLKKVDTTGMKKMSDFFSKGINK